MRHAPHRLLSFAAASCLFAVAGAQDPVRLEPVDPMIRVSIVDATALRAALPAMHLGRLFAEPEVAAAIEVGRSNYVARVRSWTEAVDRLLQVDPGRATIDMLSQREVMDIDWRDLATAELVATLVPDDAMGRLQTAFLLEPIPTAEGRMTQQFERLATRLRSLAIDATGETKWQLGADKFDGYPALVLEDRRDLGAAEDYGMHARGGWMLQLPGQFAGGDGTPAVTGRCQPTAPRAPAITLQLDLRGYLQMLGLGADDEATATAWRAFGLDSASELHWTLCPAGELLQDDVALRLQGRTGGVLGALLDGTAPLVAQPLPEHGLLQLRFAFDVGALIAAADELLVQSELPTLTELGLVADLKLAWTGGAALGVTRPAPGGLVPRLYASFGIADAAAFGRLVARLPELSGLQPKEVTYEGTPCVVLRIDGAPPALQPSYCLTDGVAHFAESGLSLRALLKARAAGAPRALEVGDAPRPEGPGAALPSFDLRFDGAAIHAALHELWLPLGGSLMGGGGPFGAEPLVPMAEMPDVEVVTAHLRPGRGVLRRSPDRITLSMSGTAGGPELHALLSSHGPLLSGPMTWSWRWQGDSLRYDIAQLHLTAVHAALQRFQERTGHLPASFGELLASGDLADARMLSLPGDAHTEAVVHEGKEIARTSFHYFAEGQVIAPQGEEIVARVKTLRAIGYRSLVLAADGVVHDAWDGAFGFAAPLRAVEVVEVEEAPSPPPPEPEPRTDAPK